MYRVYTAPKIKTQNPLNGVSYTRPKPLGDGPLLRDIRRVIYGSSKRHRHGTYTRFPNNDVHSLRGDLESQSTNPCLSDVG